MCAGLDSKRGREKREVVYPRVIDENVKPRFSLHKVFSRRVNTAQVAEV